MVLPFEGPAMTLARQWEVIVIGGGVNGTCAALHLAQDGLKTLLLDQFPLPHDRGSSGGHSRITRLSNSGGQTLTDVMKESYDWWIRLAEKTGVDLIRAQPLLVTGRPSQKSLIDRMFLAAQATEGPPPKTMTSQEINTKYGTTFSPQTIGFEDYNAGALMASKCMSTLREEYKRAGGAVADEWTVSEIEVGSGHPTEGSYHVCLNGPKGTLTCRYLVVCAGPWAHQLLKPLGVDLPLRPVKVGVFYWTIRSPHQVFPVFLDTSPSEGEVYGLPPLEYPGLAKVCFHGGPETEPSQRDMASIEGIKQWLMRYVASTFPHLVPEPAIQESCIYTMSPDQEMILDRHPEHANIVFGCGFSGTGFKTGPVVGRILALMVRGLDTGFNLTDFRKDRFPSVSSKM